MKPAIGIKIANTTHATLIPRNKVINTLSRSEALYSVLRESIPAIKNIPINASIENINIPISCIIENFHAAAFLVGNYD